MKTTVEEQWRSGNVYVIKMSKIPTIIVVFFVLQFAPTTVFASWVGGEMSCTIKDEVIKEMADGKAASYKSFENDLGVGDSFTLLYGVTDYGLFSVETEVNPLSQFWYSRDIDLENDEEIIIQASKKYNYTKVISAPEKNSFMHEYAEVRKNSLFVGVVGESILKMRRYYKSDWMGIFTMVSALKDSPVIAHTYSINCVHHSDEKWSEVFEKVMSIAINKTNTKYE